MGWQQINYQSPDKILQANSISKLNNKTESNPRVMDQNFNNFFARIAK